MAPPTSYNSYDIHAMSLLSTMRQYIANATADHHNLELKDLILTRDHLIQQIYNLPNAQPFDIEKLTELSGTLSRVEVRIDQLRNSIADHQSHCAGRIEANFSGLLAQSKLVEVNDIEGADYAKHMHDDWGWRGTTCLDRALDHNVRDDIVQHLGHAPYRFFQRRDGVVIFE